MFERAHYRFDSNYSNYECILSPDLFTIDKIQYLMGS